MKAWTLGALVVGATVVSATMASAQAAGPGQLTVGVEPSFFSGKFGTHHTLQIYDVPLTVAYRYDRLRLRIEIPYIALSGSGLVIGRTAISQGHSADFRSGPGDIWLEAEYRLNAAHDWQPSVEPYLKIKLPTASYAAGLGTGRSDEEVGGRLGWNIHNRMFPFIRLGYRVIGKVPSLHLQDVYTYEPGITFVATPKDFLTLLAIGHTAIQTQRPANTAAVIAYNRRISQRWEFQTYLSHGLDAGSADIGIGVAVLSHF